MSPFQNLSRFQKTKLIFIGIYFLFNLVILIVSFRLSLDNIRFLVDVSKLIPYAKYIASLGMLLFFILLLLQYIEIKGVKKDLKKHMGEVHVLKSKMYDMEEQHKKSAQETDKNEPENK